LNGPDSDDRRENTDGRKRIEDLEIRYRKVAHQLLAAMAVLGVAFVVCVALLVAGVRSNHRALERSNKERAERINESCTITEGKQRDDVSVLRRTYAYIADLTPAERRQPFNRAIIANLPVVEHEARTDDAPSYCDEPGVAAEKRGAKPVGLPEPDPVMPKRPPGI
jgi:hypothetical protein